MDWYNTAVWARREERLIFKSNFNYAVPLQDIYQLEISH
jgi:hypothetical protein